MFIGIKGFQMRLFSSFFFCFSSFSSFSSTFLSLPYPLLPSLLPSFLPSFPPSSLNDSKSSIYPNAYYSGPGTPGVCQKYHSSGTGLFPSWEWFLRTWNLFIFQGISHQKWGKVHRVSIHPRPTHAQPPHYQPLALKGYICYTWWAYLDTSLSPSVHGLHSGSLLVNGIILAEGFMMPALRFGLS